MAKSLTTNIERRVIRIFLSSTFEDLDVERTYLAKHIFPRLRYNLKKYNITLNDIDLRWGITENEAKSGQTVKLCMEQILNARPFFIGILGNRYGWIPGPEYLKGVQLNDDDNGKSMTEIEMRHGALNTDTHVNAAFFLKDTDDDFGESQETKDKLQSLKDDIKKSTYPVATFKDETELGVLVEKAVMDLIKEYYDLDSLSRDQLVEATQKQLLDDYLDGYVETKKHKRAADVIYEQFQAENGAKVFPIASPHGTGKRTFAAYASKSLLERGAVSHVVQYYFDDACDSASIDDAINYLIASVSKQFDLRPDDDSYHYRYQLPNRYNRLMKVIDSVDSDCPWLLTLGGIDLCPDEDFKEWLRFIAALPDKVKVIFTSGHRSNRVSHVKSFFGDFAISPHGYTDEELRTIIKNYFGQYGKTFDDSYVSMILNSKKAPNGYNCFSNMLNLHVVLNELRTFGEFEGIGDYVAAIVKDSHHDTNFIRVLIDSWSRSYDHKGNNMVEAVMSILSVSPYGLDASHVIDFLDAPVVKWQQFQSIIDPFIYCSDGRIYFHGYLATNFTVPLCDVIKPHRSRWIRYMEKCVFSDDYRPDYMLLDLAETYISYHFNIMKYLRGDLPSYYVPECFTPDFNFNHEDLISSLYMIAQNLPWMMWIHENGRPGLVRKIIGYLKKNSLNTSFYARYDEDALRWAELLAKADLFDDALKAYMVAEKTVTEHSDRIAACVAVARMGHEAGVKQLTSTYAEKGLELIGHQTEENSLLEEEIKALLMSTKSIDEWDIDEVLNRLQILGEPTQDKLPLMRVLLGMAKKFSGDRKKAKLYCDDVAVSLCEIDGLKDEMRLPMATALYNRGNTLQELDDKSGALYDYLKAYEIFSSLNSIPDVCVFESAYSAFMVVSLAMDLCINLNICDYLSSVVSGMTLLLYKRSGWDRVAWLMEDALEYMGVAVQIPDYESYKGLYDFYRKEYDQYLASRKS